MGSPAELYQFLVALGADAQRPTDSQTLIHFEAPIPITGQLSFKNFITRNLNHLRIAGEKFEFRLQGEEEAMVFINQGGRWVPQGELGQESSSLATESFSKARDALQEGQPSLTGLRGRIRRLLKGPKD
ncbi:MAG: hypothetical protein R3257_07720 [bacterium]|nr:hypothetical protein [bacterium]